MSQPVDGICVDGSSYLFRAYYAMPPLTTSQGMPSGAIYGVINMLKRLIKDHPNTPIAVVFDAKGPTFRHDMYPSYKANRDEMPSELAQQIAPLHKIIQAMGFPLIVAEGVEADDVIGTLVTNASDQGLSILISTGDKDMAQLVSERITLINTMTDVVLDPSGVHDKFGVQPHQIIDYLALMGDSSDNIPGIPKVGPKTAAKWLAKYETLDNLVAHADEITGKVGESLRENLDQLALSKTLVTIKTDVKLDCTMDQLRMASPDVATLQQWYATLEFKAWLQALQSSSPLESSEPASTKRSAAKAETDTIYELVLDQASATRWFDQLSQADVFALDVETTGLDDMCADWVGVSVAIESGRAAYIPLRHDYEGAPSQVDETWFKEQLQVLLGDKKTHLIGHNLKYDLKILTRMGVTVRAMCDDTLLMSYVLHNVTTRHDMDTLAQRFLNHTTTTFEDIAGKGAKQKTFNQIALEEAAPYAAEDADITLRLYQLFQANFNQSPELASVYNTIEKPMLQVLTAMELQGVLIDSALLNQQSDSLGKEIDQLEKQAHELAGEIFNLASPKQLQTILFDKHGLPIIKKTPKGQPSTAEAVLQELAQDYPLPEVIVRYRGLAKLKSTYTDKLPQQVNPITRRVHTHYNQAVTSTGRLSSNDPNLQNIPIRTEQGRQIRQAFVAPTGKKIVAADYSQVELRIMAHLSQDAGMLDAFSKGVDIHQATAAEVFGVDPSDVTAEQRRHAKAINFGLLYGMSAFGLSKQLQVDRQSAQHYMDAYFARYPAVLAYMESSRESAKEKGYVTTLLGRQLMMPDIQSSNGLRRKAAERAAINAPLQGTAADIIKLAMINIAQTIDQQATGMTMIMQVHDELIFEVDESDLEACVPIIRQAMETVYPLSVPLLVDIGIGCNWDEAH